MLYTPHFLVGAAIMKLVPNPVVGVPLAFVSHFALDMVPHYDFDIEPGMTAKFILSKKFKRRNLFVTIYGADLVLFLISLIWVYYTRNNLWFLIGGITATLPDLIEQSIVVLGWKLTSWQDKIQWKVSIRYGFISYPVVCLVALYIITRI